MNSWPHPSDACRMLRCWPAYPTVNEHIGSSCTEIWTSSSCAFELTRWKLETAQRTQVIWPSSNKPFEYSMVCQFTLKSFLGNCFIDKTNVLH